MGESVPIVTLFSQQKQQTLLAVLFWCFKVYWNWTSTQKFIVNKYKVDAKNVDMLFLIRFLGWIHGTVGSIVHIKRLSFYNLKQHLLLAFRPAAEIAVFMPSFWLSRAPIFYKHFLSYDLKCNIQCVLFLKAFWLFICNCFSVFNWYRILYVI